MSKRKTASKPAMKQAPVSKRRWVVLNARTDKPILGCDEGVSTEAKANRLSDSYLMETIVVPLWKYRGEPDPDEADE